MRKRDRYRAFTRGDGTWTVRDRETGEDIGIFSGTFAIADAMTAAIELDTDIDHHPLVNQWLEQG